MARSSNNNNDTNAKDAEVENPQAQEGVSVVSQDPE
jgi:hypothetical protein